MPRKSKSKSVYHKGGSREFPRYYSVEETLVTETPQVLDSLPAAPISIKPDLMVPAEDVPVAARRLEEPAKWLVNISNKTLAARNSVHAISVHENTADTIAQAAVWNAAWMKGQVPLPCCGVLLNGVSKDKPTRADPGCGPQIHRSFVFISQERARAFFADRQADYWIRARALATRSDSGSCVGFYGNKCDAYDLCHGPHARDIERLRVVPAFAEGAEAVKQELRGYAELAGLEHAPWAERADAPSPWGMSKYGVLNTCGLLYYWFYELELRPSWRRQALDVGSAFHILCAGLYRGKVLPAERDNWNQIPFAERSEALRLWGAYCTAHGEDAEAVMKKVER